MSDTALAEIASIDNLPSVSAGDDAVFNELAQGGGFLPRIQLYSKGAAVDQRLIPPGSWGIPQGEDKVRNLGESIDVLVFARRPKALDTSSEPSITVYDSESAEFKRIAAESSVQDSGCMYGVSFLVFERASKAFAEIFFGTKSSRPEAKEVYRFMPLTAAEIKAKGLEGVEPHGPIPVTLKTKFVKKPKYSWFVPEILPCSLPIEGLPAIDKIVAEMKKFLTPEDASQVETVEEKKGGRRAR